MRVYISFLFHSQHFKGLVTRGGGGVLQNEWGGASEVLPLQKGRAEKVLAMLKGGHNSV